TPVDIEPHAVQPGFVQQIRRRDALLDPLPDQRLDALGACGSSQVRAERQAESTQDEECGFVASVVRAVAVMQARGAQPALGLVNELPQLQGSRARSVSRE